MGKALTDEEAREIAERVCAENGWTFLEPLRVQKKGNAWLITTNSSRRGCNARIEVDGETRAVLAKNFCPR